MKSNVFLVTLVVVLFFSCTRKRFDHIEPTELERYSIVYQGVSCGLYDNSADSLVSALKYQTLSFGRLVVQDGVEVALWACLQNDCKGLLAIDLSTNEIMEIIFPNE